MKLKIVLPFVLALFLSLSCKDKSHKEKLAARNSPNIIYILADDLGYGDLSCYGQTKFSTPNIDKLAKQGLLFTQHYAGSTVCAPSRASLFTGFNTGNTTIRGNKPVAGGQFPLPDECFTIVELLKKHNYKTGLFGKWGLGGMGTSGNPLKQGFDEFYGYNDQRLAHHYYPDYLWDNNEKVTLKENLGLNKKQYAPILIHERAMEFLKNNQKQPFFLYYPSIIPHAELFAPETHLNLFKEKYNEPKPYKGTDGGKDYKQGKYGSCDTPRAAFAAMITLLDEQVGDIMKKVTELGIEDHTIIIFTSDNGPHKEGGADPMFFNSNGQFKGSKRDLYEGGIRVPMIVKWPSEVAPNTTTNHISAFWDVMPTIADLLNDPAKIETNGISFLPTLKGIKTQKKHESLYWEFHEKNGRKALLKDHWKLIQYNVRNEGEYQLYNLENDPKEKNNLANDLPEKVAELVKLMDLSRTQSKDFNF